MISLQELHYIAYIYNVFFLLVMSILWERDQMIQKSTYLGLSLVGIALGIAALKGIFFPNIIYQIISVVSGIIGVIFMFGKVSGNDLLMIFLFRLFLILSAISTMIFFIL